MVFFRVSLILCYFASVFGTLHASFSIEAGLGCVHIEQCNESSNDY